MQLGPPESPSDIIRLAPRLERKVSQRFSFLKTEFEEQQTMVQNNRDRIKQNLRGQIQILINKPLPVPKDILVELQELGVKLDVEITPFDSEYIYPNTKVFDEQYTMHEILGEGCLGLVKRIVHRETQSEYAVKIVQTQDDEIIRNMIIEFKSLIKLQHENIVKVHKLFVDFDNRFQSESRAYVVMELIKGQEMFEVLNELGHYSESDAKELFRQLLTAIEHLHRHGICHRDLKPNNILCVSNKKQIKVTDFNVSKFSDSYKEFGDLKHMEKIEMWTYTGTVSFSAPEIFTGEGYNQMVDMWSAGCILYAMLSGQLPFNADYLNDLIDEIKEAKISFNKEFEGVSEEAKDLISLLLQKDWTLRPHPDAALKHSWFTQKEGQKSLLKRFNITMNNLRLSSKYSRNNHRQKSILLGSQQLIINMHSMELRQNQQMDQMLQGSANMCSMRLDSPNKKSQFYTAYKVPENELSIYDCLPPSSPDKEPEIQEQQIHSLMQCSERLNLDEP